jgi:hypothetical protein
MTNPTVKDNSDAPKEAISALAKDLYQNAEVFCSCAKNASEQCPLCPSFKSFKTLLFESLDACQALDEIDCDAWSEFWKPCKDNLESEFSKSDFKSKEQCKETKAVNRCIYWFQRLTPTSRSFFRRVREGKELRWRWAFPGVPQVRL